MTGELTAYGDNLMGLLSPKQQEKMVKEAGMAAKKIAVKASRPLSTAKRYGSVFGRQPSAGFDVTGPSEVTVNHRPGSVWVLQDQGRRGSGRIYPRVNGRRNKTRPVQGRAVLTPWGPRASTRYSTSKPPHPGLLRETFGKERTAATKAAYAAFTAAVAATVRGGINAGRTVGQFGSGGRSGGYAQED